MATQTITGGLSASSVNESAALDIRTGNTTNITSGGLSAASVGNETITRDRIGNTRVLYLEDYLQSL